MSDAPDSPPPRPNATGCGIFAAIGFFLIAAFPVLIFAGMQGGACEGGPCHPERVVSSETALAWLAVAAVIVGVLVRAIVARRGARGAPWWAYALVAAVVVLGFVFVMG